MKISYKVLFAAVLSIAGTNAFAADITGLATTNYVKGAVESLDSTVATGDGAIDTITQKDGKITATHRKLSNKDIADGAAIATTKISGLDTALSGKQTIGNLVDTTDKIEANKTSTTKYPSMAVAQQIAATAAATEVTEVTSKVNSLEGDLDALATTVEENKDAADSAINTANGKITKLETTVGSSTSGLVKDVADLKTNVGSTNVGTQIDNKIKALNSTVAPVANQIVKSVTQENGVIKPVYGQVATADIADGAVDGKKIKDGAITGTNGINISKNATTGAVVVDGAGTKYTLPTATTSVLGGVKSSAVVTATDGVLGIGSEQITSGMIKNGEVKEADIGAQAVSTAKIKSPTATECASGNCALVDLGTGAQWLPIVNEYN